MLEEAEYQRWRQASSRSLTTARVAAQAEQHEWACFLAEQSAQLGLKGMLHALGEPQRAWGHDVVALADRLSSGDPGLPEELVLALGQLARHYTPARYPDVYSEGGPAEHYHPADAKLVIDQAKQVRAYLDEQWRLLREADEAQDENEGEDR